MAASSEAHGWVLEAVDRFEQPLTRYARRLLGDVDLAADAVQHAFVMLCGESRARVENHVAPWLFRVCRNRALAEGVGGEPVVEAAGAWCVVAGHGCAFVTVMDAGSRSRTSGWLRSAESPRWASTRTCPSVRPEMPAISR